MSNQSGSLRVGALSLALVIATSAGAQMVTGPDIPGFYETFRLDKSHPPTAYEVQQIGVRTGTCAGANVLWPGETATFTFRLINTSDAPLRAAGKVQVVQYGTRGRVGDVWVPDMFRIADVGSTPIDVDAPARGTITLDVKATAPETFGGYALIFDLGPYGRRFGAALVRTVPADPGRVQYPKLGIDGVWPHETTAATFIVRERVGAKGMRMEAGYFPTTDGDFDQRLAQLARHLKWAQDHHIAVMLTLGAGGPQPLGRPRPWLDEKGNFLDTKTDMAWLPAYDEDFEKWVTLLCSRFGWPKGPVNAVELWNEPWEGLSISGWGADMIRYRNIYGHMALGVEAARREAGVEVLIGGACSSSNTLDKFFADGTDTFLKWLDFTSIHYQPMAAAPSLIRAWRERKSPYGPVRVWDTESWIANTDDRVGVVIASMRAQGQERTNGIYCGNVFQQINYDREGLSVCGAWSPAASLAAAQKLIGERPFERLLFTNGLPWVFVFGGRPGADGASADPDDGTVVIVGDLAGTYDRNLLLFRSVQGLKNLQTNAPVLEGASLTLSAGAGAFTLYDFYGNPVPPAGGRITVPLNGLGYFLRSDGSKGSFAKLLEAIRGSRIEGYEPLDVIAHDLTAPVASKPTLSLTLTNILNRAVRGTLAVKLGDLTLDPAKQELRFKPHETRDIALRIAAGASTPDNTYHLSLRFDAGKDGIAVHEEDMHANVIARRTIRVDGVLDDWEGVLPQWEAAGAQRPSLTERAWLPFARWDEKVGEGFAAGYLAYDDDSFYFAAKIADSTPDEGMMRYEAPDDDQFFYPEKSYDKGQELVWPTGVRRYSYRKDPELPSGDSPGHDNVQIAFNVIPLEDEPWAPNPPGTMPRFICYRCTDYEYALNPVAPRYGGGTEIWRLLVPGMPRKHFYPRQPRSPFDGPVKTGQLVITRDGAMRIVEAALPWSEIPDVRKRLDAGRTTKFSFRVNDNDGGSYELAANRSVSKVNFLAFHADWKTHWANELEFGFER
jgi:hypothetical protein